MTTSTTPTLTRAEQLARQARYGAWDPAVAAIAAELGDYEARNVELRRQLEEMSTRYGLIRADLARIIASYGGGGTREVRDAEAA